VEADRNLEAAQKNLTKLHKKKQKNSLINELIRRKPQKTFFQKNISRF